MKKSKKTIVLPESTVHISSSGLKIFYPHKGELCLINLNTAHIARKAREQVIINDRSVKEGDTNE